eukprot:588995-Pelagomonas_calceolata.AAC.1
MLHACNVHCAYKLTSTRRAIENKKTHHNLGALEPRAARNPPDSHGLALYYSMREIYASLSQRVSLVNVGKNSAKNVKTRVYAGKQPACICSNSTCSHYNQTSIVAM